MPVAELTCIPRPAVLLPIEDELETLNTPVLVIVDTPETVEVEIPVPFATDKIPVLLKVIPSALELTVIWIPDPDVNSTVSPYPVASILSPLSTSIDLKKVFAGSIISCPPTVDPNGNSILLKIPLMCADPAHKPFVSSPLFGI